MNATMMASQEVEGFDAAKNTTVAEDHYFEVSYLTPNGDYVFRHFSFTSDPDPDPESEKEALLLALAQATEWRRDGATNIEIHRVSQQLASIDLTDYFLRPKGDDDHVQTA